MVAETVTADCRRSSFHLLEMEPSGDCAQAADLLRRVAQWQYVVPSENADAAQVLVNPDALVSRPWVIERSDRCGREQRMEAAVSAFAASFFDIPTQIRREQWELLVGQSQDLPGLLKWLTDLESGLNVDKLPSFGDERLNEFVSECCTVFVARYSDRVRLRQMLTTRYRNDPALLLNVARNLQFHDWKFVSSVAGWINDLKQSNVLPFQSNAPLRPITQPAAKQRAAPQATTESQGQSWYWVAIVVFGLLRLIAAAGRSSSSPNDNPPAVRPYVNPNPSSNPVPDLKLPPKMSGEQTRAINEALNRALHKNDPSELRDVILEQLKKAERKNPVEASPPEPTDTPTIPTSEQ